MTDITEIATPKPEAAAPPAPAIASTVPHPEPQLGGSYTRNPASGALVKNEPPLANTDKE